jgi:hypothetical protein
MEPLVVPWRNGTTVRVLHDDPHLSMYSRSGQQVRAAILLASDVEGLRLALTTALGRQYDVKVSDDESVVGLWRLR